MVTELVRAGQGHVVDQESGLLFRVGQSFWLALPLILTGNLHMFAVKHNWFARLNIPIDRGRMLSGRRILGDHKTWRGVIVMTLFGGLFGALVGCTGGPWAQSSGVAPLAYDVVGGGHTAPSLALGYAIINAVLGLAYVIGELPNSIIKRRLDVPSGKTPRGMRGLFFLLVDQADSALAVLLTAVLLFGLSWHTFAVGMVSLPLLHFVFNVLLYAFRIRRNL